jgi:hypothetical protein
MILIKNQEEYNKGCTWTPARLTKLSRNGKACFRNDMGIHTDLSIPRGLYGSATERLTIIRGLRKGYNVVESKMRTTSIKMTRDINPKTNKPIHTSYQYDFEFPNAKAAWKS